MSGVIFKAAVLAWEDKAKPQSMNVVIKFSKSHFQIGSTTSHIM
jgi:hypothetical protein